MKKILSCFLFPYFDHCLSKLQEANFEVPVNPVNTTYFTQPSEPNEGCSDNNVYISCCINCYRLYKYHCNTHRTDKKLNLVGS
ncbi:uncharacterized protein LOC128250447 isoform X6 [Octopus bimaculoides]|uniref:uncharacterized protein LOC128250447 isoform X6 n=1 Tax=Octopus bimaculoides TaxID=37653 RepID=UPI0022E555CF|nr:uncharacterized protein LOC128250447 isoform X6 [Octopus bimaculoides]